MAQIICQVDSQPDQVSFTWAEGPASFAAYHLTGQLSIRFRDTAATARRSLSLLVQEWLLWQRVGGSDAAVRRASLALAEAGYTLYRRIFDQGVDDGRPFVKIRPWLEELSAQGAVESLEIVFEQSRFMTWNVAVPWNVVYDRRPDEASFLEAGGSEPWQPFWGIRYNLAGGRRVDPLRRKPRWEKPYLVAVVDPTVLGGLPAEEQRRLVDFVGRHGNRLVDSRRSLEQALSGCPREQQLLIYWLCHAKPKALVLGDDQVDPTSLLNLLSENERLPWGLAFLNACQTAESAGDFGSFLDALHEAGLSGLIATEQNTVNVFANSFGLDFLEAFLERGVPVGAALQSLRSQAPLGLLYATYCPPQIRVHSLATGTSGAATAPGEVAASAERERRSPQPAARLLGGRAADPLLLPLPSRPYPSLANYDRRNRALFVGRGHDVRRFAVVLDDPRTRILVLHGESGVGKSSFLRAGVVPYLEEECIGYRVLRGAPAGAQAGGLHEDADRAVDGRQKPPDEERLLFVRATHDPVGQLAQALCDFCARPHSHQQPPLSDGTWITIDLQQKLATALRLPPPPTARAVRTALTEDADRLGDLLAALGSVLPFRVVLVIDQAEEMFTLARTEDDAANRRVALEMLRRALAIHGNFKVIVSLRTEYYGRLVDPLRRATRHSSCVSEYLLTDLGYESLVQSILRPTSASPIELASEIPFEKYRFRYAEDPRWQDGVAGEIARQALQSAGARRDSVLPLVQVICAQLYDAMVHRGDHEVRAADLQEIGGIQGGMRRGVEAMIEGLFPRAADGDAFRRLLATLYLRQPDGGVTTALVAEDRLAGSWRGSMPLSSVLATASRSELRLLRVTTLRRGEQDERRYVSLGHDALAPIAAGWDEGFSRRRRLRRNALALGLATSVALLFAVLSGILWRTTRIVNAQRREALSRPLAVQADALRAGSHRLLTLSTLLAIEGHRRLPSVDTDAALRADLDLLPYPVATVHHSLDVEALALSADGALLATGSRDRSLRIWETRSGRQVRRFNFDHSVRVAAFSRDGRYLGAGSGDFPTQCMDRLGAGNGEFPSECNHRPGEARLWDLRRSFGRSEIGQPLHFLEPVGSALFVGQPPLFMASDATLIGIMQLGDPAHPLTAAVSPGNQGAWTPDGRFFAHSEPHGLRIIDAVNRKTRIFLKAVLDVERMAFSPDGSLLAVGGTEGEGSVWRWATGEKVAEKKQQESMVNAVAIAPDRGLVAQMDFGGVVSLWSMADGLDVARFLADPDRPEGGRRFYLHFGPGADQLTVGGPGSAMSIYSLPPAAPAGGALGAVVERRRLVLDSNLTIAAFNADGRYLAAGAQDGTVQVWEPRSWMEPMPFEVLGLSSGGRYALYRSSPQRLAVARSGDLLRPLILIDADRNAAGAVFSDDDRYFAAVGAGGALRVFDLQSVAELPLATPAAPSGGGGRTVQAVRFVSSRRLLVLSRAGGDSHGVVDEIDVPSGRVGPRRRYPVAERASFSGDGRYLAMLQGTGQLWLFDLVGGRMVATFAADTATPLLFSRDGRWLVTRIDDNDLAVIETASGRRLRTVTALDTDPPVVDLSPDGRFLAAAEGADIKVWELPRPSSAGQEPMGDGPHQRIHGTGDKISDLLFSPDSEHLALRRLDQTIEVWSLATRATKVAIRPETWFSELRFTPDGKHLVASRPQVPGTGALTEMLLWRSQDLIDEACHRIRRNLTPEEWNQYLPGEPYRPTCPNLPPQSAARR